MDFLAATGVPTFDDVQEQHVTEFLMRLREGDGEHPPLGAGSAARAVVAVRGLHRFLLREGTTGVDPAAGVKPPSPAKRLPKALPLDAVERLLAAAGSPGTALAMRDRALLELLYGTGARISEAVGLDVDDVELDSGAVRLMGKGSKQRAVPGRVLRRRGGLGVPGPRSAPALRRRTQHAGAVPERTGRPALPAERVVGAALGRRTCRCRR